MTQDLTRWRFKLQKHAHFKNGRRRSVFDDLSCPYFRYIYANERAILADVAFDVTSDEENSTEYSNPVDSKCKQHPSGSGSGSGSVRQCYEISIVLAEELTNPTAAEGW